MKKLFCFVVSTFIFFGCSNSDSDGVCTNGMKHGEIEQCNDCFYEEQCVVVNGEPVLKAKCENEGEDISPLFGEAGFAMMEKYKCVKDDDSHLYRTEQTEAKCDDGKSYCEKNDNNEVCVYLDDKLVYKPACPDDADKSKDCKRDNVFECYYHE